MFVYIIYDPLLEKVLCVHTKPNTSCPVCDKAEYRKRESYHLEECKKKVRLPKGKNPPWCDSLSHCKNQRCTDYICPSHKNYF